jgi:hypothetical protein
MVDELVPNRLFVRQGIKRISVRCVPAMDPAFRDYRKNDWGHLMLRLDNGTRDSNAGQIGAFLAERLVTGHTAPRWWQP